MKKALVLALSVFMVLALATAAFAAEVTYEGKVAVTFGGDSKGDTKNGPAFAADTLDAKIFVDYQKDYGDGVTAGVKTKLELDKDEAATDLADGFKFDGAGWIQLEKDLFTVKAATKLNDQAGRDLKENPIAEKPGVSLKLNLIEGLTVNAVVNEGKDFNYVLKGEYADDLFTVGGGFQNSEIVKQGFAVYGTLNVIDGLTLKGEFGSRDANKDDDIKAATGILATADYTLDALTAKAGFLMQDKGFGASFSKDDLNDEGWRINETIRSTKFNDAFVDWDKQFANYFKNSEKVAVIFADASYKVTDALEVNGYFDYLVSAKDADDNKVEDLEKVSYKLGAAYTLDALKFEGWYKAYVGNEFGGKATYTLVDGVETSFQVTYGKEDKDNNNEDGKVAYTAKIVATL